MRKKIISFGLCLLIVSLWLCLPDIANAQNSIIDPTDSKYTYGRYNLNDILFLVTWAAEWILGIIGSLTLIMFIYGGFIFLTSSGSSEKVGEAKKIITAAVIGLIIVFASYMIVQFAANALGLRWDGGELRRAVNSNNSSGTSSLSPNSISGEGSACSTTNNIFKCTSSTNTGYCLSDSENPCQEGLKCCAPACSEAFIGYNCVMDTANSSCQPNYCPGKSTCCISKCVQQKGSEGFSCMDINKGKGCVAGLCPGTNSTQCCQPK